MGLQELIHCVLTPAFGFPHFIGLTKQASGFVGNEQPFQLLQLLLREVEAKQLHYFELGIGEREVERRHDSVFCPTKILDLCLGSAQGFFEGLAEDGEEEGEEEAAVVIDGFEFPEIENVYD